VKGFLTIWFLLTSVVSLAQEVPPPTQKQLENLADVTEAETVDDIHLLQQLEYYLKHPINLNAATADELKQLQLLTDLQIDHLIKYRNLLGKLISVYELQAIPAWDVQTIRRILPFITVTNQVNLKESFKERLKGGNKMLLFRVSRILEESIGYDTTRSSYYLGDRNHLLFQYRYQYKNLLYYGLTADKDAGEQFFKGAQNKGFDFYSAHFFARDLGNIKALAIGDYSVNLGQGLIQWHSLAFKKSSEVLLTKRQAPVLLPYRSPGEFYFNRGIGATYKKGNIETTLFASYKKIGGNISVDSTEVFTSFNSFGYYRTKNETEERNNINLTSYGGNISFGKNLLKVGLNGIAHQFSLPLQKRDEPYNYYVLSGKSWMNASVDYSYTYKNVHLFGEVAVDKNFSRAVLSGLLVSLDPKADLSIIYRNMQKEYQTLFGNAFTESVLPSNEKGIYAGINFRPFTNWQINAYGDFYSFPFLRYRIDAPGKGRDYLVHVSYKPNKMFEMYLRYRNEVRPLNVKNGTFNSPEQTWRQNLRFHFLNTINRTWQLKGRVELNWFNRKGADREEGFLTYVEGSYTGFQKLSLNTRLQYFETGGYNSRIYAYENDVLYSFSIPAFFNKGFRYYLNVNYDISKQFTVWVRLAQSHFKDAVSIGSGTDEIKGNQRSEIKLQIIYKVDLR
jgi:hypothetical protein